MKVKYQMLIVKQINREMPQILADTIFNIELNILRSEQDRRNFAVDGFQTHLPEWKCMHFD